MKQYWLRFAANMDARNQRERALIFFTALILVGGLGNMLVLDPLAAKAKSLRAEQSSQQGQLAEIAAKIRAIESSGRSDPDAPMRQKLAELREEQKQTAAALQGTQQSLVAPDKMARLLEDMLSQNRGLKLLSLRTLPVSDVLDAETVPARAAPAGNGGAVAQPPSSGIFKHGVEISVAGSYADLTRYLENLENLPWRMFWGKVRMKVVEYPQVTLTITVYTLSMDRAWLSI